MIDGGSAFPLQTIIAGHDEDPPMLADRSYPGMTLRDYFAGQTLQAISRDFLNYENGYKECTEHAYKMADAMLAERSKQNEQ